MHKYLTVVCPACGAAVGNRCEVADGTGRRRYPPAQSHKARKELWKSFNDASGGSVWSKDSTGGLVKNGDNRVHQEDDSFGPSEPAVDHGKENILADWATTLSGSREERIQTVLWAINFARSIGTIQSAIDRSIAAIIVDGVRKGE